MMPPASAFRWLATFGAVLAAAAPAAAKPAHKQALISYFGPFLPPKLHDCRTCHLPDPSGGPGSADEGEKPHNAFGARLAAVKVQLRKAGKDPTIAARLEAIAEEDSDGDGVSNLLELLTGHAPGDPADKPTPAELEKAKSVTLPAFRKSQAGYAWRPFEPVRRPELPAVRNRSWARQPLDLFIAAEHEARGLKPRPEADKPTLLRRVHLDLVGLPPTPEELHAFLADASPDAYEKVVDRLLASPRYGERWGRHWMDVWRYSDWAGWGQQVRDSQPHVWHWRDWIIESLNHDKGYDQMVREMLAADELYPDDLDRLRATGYLVRNFKLLSREKWMQDVVDHTFLAFQGVTVGCARCHDHMFDPIAQREYYQVRAVFEPHNVRTDRLPGEPNVAKNGLPRAFDADVQAPTYLFVRGDDRTPDKSKPVPPGVPECFGLPFPEVKPVALPLAATAPDRRDFVVRDTVAASEQAAAQARQKAGEARRVPFAAAVSLLRPLPLSLALTAAQARAAAAEAQLAETTSAMADAKHAALLAVLKVERLEDAGVANGPEWESAAKDAQVAQRRAALAEARRNLFLAESGPPATNETARKATAERAARARQAVTQAEAELGKPATTAYTKRTLPAYPATSTGRRTALARWLTDPRNPLTARVAVNHVWLRHFGQALEPSVFDFGRNGRPPSHPALLDWLASEFMREKWSLKALHRQIVLSATYRQASTPDPADLALDRDNLSLWRMPPRRLEAEAVRDQVLFVSGRLDLATGGPEIDHALGLTVPRRSLYFRHAAEKQMEFLKLFDAAAVTECYQRKESVVPQQALALANSELTVRSARLLARALSAKCGPSPEAFVRAAFERVLCRPPTDAELTECVGFLSPAGPPRTASGPPDPEGKAPAADPALRAREGLVQVLFNHHEFVTVR
jgi:hypothetical protein